MLEDEFKKLEVGQKVLYVAGKGKCRCGAEAIVSQKPGSTGCFIIINKYIEKGTNVDHQVGDEILAGPKELL